MRGRIAVSVAAAAALVVSGMAGPNLAQAAPKRVGLSKSKPAWLARSRQVGKASTATTFRVYMAPRNGLAGLQAAALAASTPGSSQYRKFLTSAQYHAAYDPTAASVSAVSKWLTASGVKVSGIGENNSYLEATGSVAAVQKAFATTINRYTHDGQTVQANASDLTVPTTVAAAVLSVSGVDTTKTIMKPASTPIPPPDGFNNAKPCSQYYGQIAASKAADFKTPLPKFKGKTIPYAVCGYTGIQFRTAYEADALKSGLTGAGVTVAVVDAYNSPTMLSDAKTYAKAHGDAPWTPGQYTAVTPKAYTLEDECGANGWWGEQTLDVEAVHAMAPDAKVRYYASVSCSDPDFIDVIAKVVNQNKVQLVTNSYGEAESVSDPSLIAPFEAVVLQGALQGISFTFSSGDDGDELADTGLKEADSSADDPYVTAVGGTASAIGSDGKFIFQTGWGTEKYSLAADGKSWTSLGYLYGAGGGYSAFFNRPAYQKGVVPASAPPGRAVPDVAMDADPTTGMLVGQTQLFPEGVHYGEYRIGGTSLASPLFAGMTALLVQNAGGGLGLLNPLIYKQAGTKTFTDIKGSPKDAGNVRSDFVNGTNIDDGLVYSVRTFDQDSSLTTVKGWDDVTGIGVPTSGWTSSVKPKS